MGYYQACLILTPAHLPLLPVGSLWRKDKPQKKLTAFLGGQDVNSAWPSARADAKQAFVAADRGCCGAFARGSRSSADQQTPGCREGQLHRTGTSWTELKRSAIHALGLLFHIGLKTARALPQTLLPPKLISVTAKNQGLPTPMLAITSLPLDFMF
ncbi:hypothetical protein PTTG_05168 [Puccinia triticina 1-1 BBBD Race 1]|uniref:Uncharacterized protein n=1 Tax=Puccinia triticina (isolate 1-1 / race 1 (BBBD)) TaxID=630390 RepID=A0A0C4EWH3_PUCT1|nr:hypothetical protein PTTG_05168 [Puccinia triticina 1-1 BBBD Race 1]